MVQERDTTPVSLSKFESRLSSPQQVILQEQISCKWDLKQAQFFVENCANITDR
jgi:hypothetical protein